MGRNVLLKGYRQLFVFRRSIAKYFKLRDYSVKKLLQGSPSLGLHFRCKLYEPLPCQILQCLDGVYFCHELLLFGISVRLTLASCQSSAP